MDIALVLPTIREKHCLEFLEAWDFESQGVQVYVVEDNPERTFDLSNAPGVAHIAWDTIQQALGSREWIIPRRTAAIRSFGYLQAYKDGADVILTLDDDCLPMGYPDSNDERRLFTKDHVLALSRTHSRWVDTIHSPGISARGVPFDNQGKVPTVINMGGWANVPDLGAVTTLALWGDGVAYRMEQWNPVPTGKYFSLCGMNVGFRREATVLMYQLLMSQNHKGEHWPFVRFDDIWGGVIAKKICDDLNWAITTGFPEVWHSRASNVWTNLKHEVTGLEVNERFWEAIDGIPIESETSTGAYYQMAQHLEFALSAHFPDYKDYWKTLCAAMRIWVEEVARDG